METSNGNKKGHKTTGHRLTFDNFEVDRTNRTILRDGEALQLTGKVFDVLLAFAENPGRLLSKNELIEKVWNGDFVEEGNLARNVSSLRKTLGDESKPHKYIETVPGHGYRFVADVADVGNVPVPPPVEPFPPSGDGGVTWPDRRVAGDERLGGETGWGFTAQLFGRPRFLTLAVICLAATVIIAFRFEGHKPRQIEALTFDRIRRSKLTQDGDVYGGSISPNGQYLAYTRIVGNDKALSLRQVATGSVVDLRPPRSDIDYWATSFSPDNTFLYYIAHESGSDEGNIFRIPLLGGNPRRVMVQASGGLAISPDGTRLAFVRIDREKRLTSIIVADADGSNDHSIGSCDVDSGYFSLDWSPNGDSLIYAFRRHGDDHDLWYLAEVSAAGGPERPFGDASVVPVLKANWLPDRSGLIVNAVDEATRQPQIYSVSYPDGVKRRITNDLNSYVGFSMTADARIIILPQTNSNRQIWTIADGHGSAPIQITSGSENHYESVSWIGNDYIVYDQDENGSFDKFNIWRMRPDGTERVQLTFGADNNTQPAVSPDGRIIVYVSRRSGKRQIWRMAGDASGALQLSNCPSGVFNPSISLDGKWVYFRRVQDGKSLVQRISIDGGDTFPVFDDGVHTFDISPDGSRIVFSSVDPTSGTDRTRIRFLDGRSADTPIGILPETWVTWSRDGQALYFNSGRNLWTARLDGSPPHPITEFKEETVFGCGWSPDGTRSACLRQAISYDAVMLQIE